MKRVAVLMLVAVAAGCSSSDSIAIQSVEVASLAFDIPADWQRHDANRRGVAISEWVPEDNERKESVTVIRTETSPAVAKADVSALTPLLAAAQKSLPQVRASRVTPVTTARGLSGARIEVDFIPPGMKQSYHRIHVVLVDGSGALVHVLYTARSPNRKALDLVLDSIRREEA
jgi:hypothetical protein